MHHLPVIARIDGRAFHTFTHGMDRPFDEEFTRAMDYVTCTLVEEFKPVIAYVQSDEITLVWYYHREEAGELLFGGRIQKLTSVLASAATAAMATRMMECKLWGDKPIPHFDARVWQVPRMVDVIDVLTWRQDDAEKNSIQMLARAHMSHKDIQGKSGKDMCRMLEAKGIVWGELPARFKRGTFVRRVTEWRALTTEERERIPEPHRPPPGQMFERHAVKTLDWPRIRAWVNKADTIINGAEPLTLGES
jgi:tRNA(His) guanylyltransferase